MATEHTHIQTHVHIYVYRPMYLCIYIYTHTHSQTSVKQNSLMHGICIYQQRRAKSTCDKFHKIWKAVKT